MDARKKYELIHIFDEIFCRRMDLIMRALRLPAV